MKKLTLLVAFTMLLQMSFAGGLLTNYNQSAQYVRMLSRNAALEIDAVFYNPAGLIKLEEGWHFAFHSQTIFQTREILIPDNTGFPLLNDNYYEGTTTIPIFPNLYAAYKKDKWAFSLGIGPTAGGGSAEFDSGIPSLEIPFSKVVPGLAGLAQIDPSMAVTGYDLEMAFEASSVYWGIQLGATYAINDKLSVYGGMRFVPASNTYDGYIQNIQLEVAGQKVAADDWLNGTADELLGLAGQASAGAGFSYGAADGMQPIIDGGGGGYTLAQLEGAGMISAQQKAQLEGGLVLAGVPQEQIDMMNAGQIQGAYSAAGDELIVVAELLSGTSSSLSNTAESMEDLHVDSKQKGFGLTPMLGVNFSPNDDWNIAAKYEFQTKVTLKNETVVDDLGLFPDGVEGRYDIPAVFAAGVGYRGLDWLEAQLSYNMYFDKGVDYRNNVRYLVTTPANPVKREIEHNHFEVSLGLQFNLSDKFAISVGGLRSQNGVAPSYQSDFSFSNSANAIGGGIMWKITEKLVLDAGISNIFYEDDTVDFMDPDVGAYDENFDKTTLNLAVGLSYSIF